MSDDIHVFQSGEHWAIKREGAAEVLLTAPTREEAISTARVIAETAEVELVIHSDEELIGVESGIVALSSKRRQHR